MNKPSVNFSKDGFSYKLVFFNRKIEIYALDKGMETFTGYLEYSDKYGFFQYAKGLIIEKILKDPISSDTLTILDTLHWQGMLPEQNLISW